MRRKDREITDINEILAVMRRCQVVRVAMFDGAYPYIIPLNFGFDVKAGVITLYFHCAGAGKKLELLKACGRVAFEMDHPGQYIDGDTACRATMPFESVCGTGTLEIAGDDEKLPALRCLMAQYSDKGSFEFDDKEVRAVTVLKLTVNEITGKHLIP